MTNLFLKMLGSYIQVIFESAANSTTRRNIRRFYGNYIVSDAGNARPVYRLFVHDNYRYSFLKKNGKAFVSFFEETGPDRIDVPDTLDSVQFDLLMRILIHNLARKKDMFILHTSAILVGGKARIFIGRNGIGKSTIVKMLKKDFLPLCDDKVVIRRDKKNLYLYQVPYRETNNYRKSGLRYPVGGFYVLKQEKAMRIRKINLLREHEFIARVCSEICVDNNRRDIVDLTFSLKDNLFELGFTKRSRKKLIAFFTDIQNNEATTLTKYHSEN